VSRRRRPPRVPGMSSRTLLVLPSIADALDEATKNGLAIRNAATVNGRCPACSARGELYPVERGISRLVFWHADGCPALRDPHDYFGEEVA